MYPHVYTEGGIISKFLVANLTAVAGSVFGIAERSLDVGQYMLLQGGVGGKSTPAGPHWAFERRLARVGHPMEVKAFLGHATVATEVTFNLRIKCEGGAKRTKKKLMEGSRYKEGQLQKREVSFSIVMTRSHLEIFSPPGLLAHKGKLP